jgi:hypothetical protein
MIVELAEAVRPLAPDHASSWPQANPRTRCPAGQAPVPAGPFILRLCYDTAVVRSREWKARQA